MSDVNDFRESSGLVAGDVGVEDVGVGGEVDVAAAAAAAAAAADAVSGPTTPTTATAMAGVGGAQGGGLSMSATDTQTPKKRGRKRKTDSLGGGDAASTATPTVTAPTAAGTGASVSATTTTPTSTSALYTSVAAAEADISWYEIRVVSPDDLPCHSDAEFMEGIQEPVVMREAADGNVPRGWGKRGRPRKNVLPPTPQQPQSVALATLVPDRGRQPEMRRMIIHAIKRRWVTLADWRRIPKNISEAVNHVQDFINAHRVEVELGDDEQHDDNAFLPGDERKRVYYYLDQTVVARAFKAKWKRNTTSDQRDAHSKCRIGALLLRPENRDDVLRLLSSGHATTAGSGETDDEDARCGELWEMLHGQYMDDENSLVPIPDMLQKLDSPMAEEFEPNGEMGIEVTPLRSGEAMAKTFWTRMAPQYRAAIESFVQGEIQQQHKQQAQRQTDAEEGDDGEETAAAATSSPSPPPAWKIQNYAIGTPWIHWLFLLDVQLSGEDAADSESGSFLYARTTDLIPQSAEELRRRSGHRYFQDRPSLPQNTHAAGEGTSAMPPSSRWAPQTMPRPSATPPAFSRSMEQARVPSGGTARPTWLSGGGGGSGEASACDVGGGGGGDAQHDVCHRHVIAAFREGVLAGRHALPSSSLTSAGLQSSSPFSVANVGGGGRRHLVEIASDIYRIRTFIKETTLLPDAAFVRGPQERADDLKRYTLTLKALHDEHDRLYLQRVHTGSIVGGGGGPRRHGVGAGGRLSASYGTTAAPAPAAPVDGNNNNDSGSGIAI